MQSPAPEQTEQTWAQTTTLRISSSTSSDTSASIESDLTSGGALKRYRLLDDIYDECDELLFMHDSEEPLSYSMASENVDWVNAMRSELEAIEKNKTWNLVELPPGRKPIGLKWVYKLKKDPEEKVLKHRRGW